MKIFHMKALLDQHPNHCHLTINGEPSDNYEISAENGIVDLRLKPEPEKPDAD